MELPFIKDEEDKTCPFKNRLRKNYRHVRKWACRTDTNCFRIYDRDIKEYPLLIDFYDGVFCVQYFTFDRENDQPPTIMKNKIESALGALFAVNPTRIYWRTRIKRAKNQQYEKLDAQKQFLTVCEYGVKFKVNLNDYLDTGLFLDHRETRRFVASISKNKRLLNLFAYTCSFSVHAAVAGAKFTKSVDMSNTYTAWGKQHFLMNAVSMDNNQIVRADCMQFIEEEICSGCKYDVIVIDPPTISRSKKMTKMFDIQLDYVNLIVKALLLLDEQGVIFFSTNSRKFHFDVGCFPECKIKDVSKMTIPIDFHNQKVHQCWKIFKS